jgi:hypothetical protein
VTPAEIRALADRPLKTWTAAEAMALVNLALKKKEPSNARLKLSVKKLRRGVATLRFVNRTQGNEINRLRLELVRFRVAERIAADRARRAA